jgi:hypothetical protein
VSRTERTRFRVRLTSERKDGAIMIGSDDITITLTSANLSVRASDNGHGALRVGNNPELGLKLSDLVNGFKAGASLLRTTSDNRNEQVNELVKTMGKNYDTWCMYFYDLDQSHENFFI